MYKNFQLIPKDTIKGAAIQSLAQGVAGSDEFGELLFGGGFAGTGVGGFVGVASVDGVTNNLTVSAVTEGTLLPNVVVTLAGVPVGTTVSGQVSGVTGGPGVYTLSGNSTAVQNNVQITAPQALLTITAATAGLLGGGNAFAATGSVGAPKVLAQLTGIPGGVGTYSLSSPQSFASTGISTPASTGLADGDSFTLSTSSWTPTTVGYTNKDTTTTSSRKFWLKVLGASALVLGDASLVPTRPGKVVGMTINNHGLTPGAIFGVGTEVFRVIVVRDPNTLDVYRGYAGSLIATHAQGAAVLTLANYTGINLLTDIIVPLTDTTLAVAGPEIVSAMVALDGFNPKDYGDLASGIIKQASLGYGFDWEYIPATNRLFFHRPCRGTTAGATTLTINASITNGVMSQLKGGVQIGEVKSTVETRVPTAAEVAAGYMDFAFPWPVKSVLILGDLTATDGPAVIGSAVSFSPDFRRLTLTNGGTNNFQGTESVTVWVTG